MATGWGRGDGGAREGDDPDGWLLLQAREDPAAFGQFYDRNRRAVLRYFLRHTGQIHLATELTAETFAQALAGLHRYDPGQGAGAAWLFGIAAHQRYRLLRRGAIDRRYRAQLRMATPLVTPDDADRIAELADASELIPQLEAALEQLTDGVRAAVELRVAHELPYAEVAARLGCTEGNARVRVARGLRQLSLAMVPL